MIERTGTIVRRRAVRPAWLFLLWLCLPIGCASIGDRATVPVERGAAWSVQPFASEAVDERPARQVDVLLDSALRARGLSPHAGDGSRVGSRTRAAARPRSADARYELSGTVRRWEPPRRPGARGTIALDVTLIDRDSGERLLQRSAVRRGGARDGMTALATAVLDELLAPLRATGAVRDATNTATAPVAVAVDELRASGASADGVMLAVRSLPATVPVDAATVDALRGRSTALFYADALPVALLAQFDRVVLEPDNTDAAERRAVARDGAALFAYLSIGEVGPARAWGASVEDDWVLGRNEAWDSCVMDLRHPGWADHVVDRVDALMADGYDGLFLDTMDSFSLHARTPVARATQAAGLAALIERIVQRHPDIRLIANRGFEVLDAVGEHLEALAAESLYASWDNVAQRYGPVAANDRAWLLGQLERARDRYALDIIAIDYVPPAERERARAVASRIAAHGFVPWVATPALDHVGVGALDVLPREVLLPYDSRVNGAQESAEVHRLLATPLEYLGYVPVYHDLATRGLPPASLGGRYAGIAYWAREPQTDGELQAWLALQVRDGVRIALFGTHIVEAGSPLAALTGLQGITTLAAGRTRVRHQDDLLGFEQAMPTRFEPLGLQPRSVSAANRVHLSLEDASGRTADPVVTGDWGGVAITPAVIEVDLDDTVRWRLDPFAFLSRSLDLQRAPMPDVTSEGGARLWMAHIDGDALPSWSELPGRRLGAEVIRDRILDRWPLPHTVSVVEAELTRLSAVADRRARMVSVARELFARPEVEIASHTFSHPFLWGPVRDAPTSGTANLPVGDYRYSAEREVAGSAAFIDALLAPPGKRTRVMLWSGDALPGEDALAAAERAGLANMNGGLTTITHAYPVLHKVTPMARTVGERVQVYAPIMNENVYTNSWQGPFDGFRRVIETLELTERPRRLKPINIYYHFYAGTKAAAVRSLEEVYAWSTAQDMHPVTVSDYTSRVNVFRTAGMARTLDGRFRPSGLGALGSLRLVGEGDGPDERRSEGLSAVRRLHDGVYLTVRPDTEVLLALDGAAGVVTTERRDGLE